MPSAPLPDSELLGLADRAPIYAWLAQLLARETGAADWERLRLEPIRSILVRLEPALEDDLSIPLTSERQEELAEEFARLFLLPGGVSPFASSWIASKAGHERTRDEVAGLVSRGFEAVDRELVEREPWGRLPRDHVALIFDLVAQARLSEDPLHHEVAAYFDRELIGAWITSFGRALHSRAKLPLHRALGLLVAQLHSSPSD